MASDVEQKEDAMDAYGHEAVQRRSIRNQAIPDLSAMPISRTPLCRRKYGCFSKNKSRMMPYSTTVEMGVFPP